MRYEYRGVIYDTLNEAENAVYEYVGQNYNNIDCSTTVEYEEELREITEI